MSFIADFLKYKLLGKIFRTVDDMRDPSPSDSNSKSALIFDSEMIYSQPNYCCQISNDMYNIKNEDFANIII